MPPCSGVDEVMRMLEEIAGAPEGAPLPAPEDLTEDSEIEFDLAMAPAPEAMAPSGGIARRLLQLRGGIGGGLSGIGGGIGGFGGVAGLSGRFGGIGGVGGFGHGGPGSRHRGIGVQQTLRAGAFGNRLGGQAAYMRIPRGARGRRL